jgi:sortase A
MRETRQRPHPERFRPVSNRTLTGVGLSLVIAGAAALGHVGWQVYGTSYFAQRDQARAVEATERAWAAHGHRSATRRDRESARDVVALIRIPALGEDYVIPAYDGTDDDTLERGFGIFDDSPAPGAAGNFAIGGHRVTHGEPLRMMPLLEAGDEVIVETADATFRYVLDTDGDSRTVATDATWITEDDPVDPDTHRPVSTRAGSTRLLTLVTCAEIFHTDERLVAFGHLVGQEPSSRRA